jgi:hypothetical protein
LWNLQKRWRKELAIVNGIGLVSPKINIIIIIIINL